MSEYAEVFYKTDEFYNREADGGINFNDPSLGLSGMLLGENLTLSEKDKKLPTLAEADFNF
jgi:dTDP-4-dehydrorhamnose 3,5-epimerase